MHEIRCENGILFGRLAEGVLEVKCRSNRCGYKPGVVVLHRFSTASGELLETNRFRDPGFIKGRKK